MICFGGEVLIKSVFGFGAAFPHLSHHAVPHVVDLLAVLAIGHQVEVIGELHVSGDLFEDVDAEALAALFDVGSSAFCGVTVGEKMN